MSKIRFVGLDVHAETIAVAVAESGGEVRAHGVIPNRLESVRKLAFRRRTRSMERRCLPIASGRERPTAHSISVTGILFFSTRFLLRRLPITKVALTAGNSPGCNKISELWGPSVQSFW